MADMSCRFDVNLYTMGQLEYLWKNRNKIDAHQLSLWNQLLVRYLMQPFIWNNMLIWFRKILKHKSGNVNNNRSGTQLNNEANSRTDQFWSIITKWVTSLSLLRLSSHSPTIQTFSSLPITWTFRSCNLGDIYTAYEARIKNKYILKRITNFSRFHRTCSTMKPLQLPACWGRLSIL